MAQSQQITSDVYPYLRIRVEIRGQHEEGLALVDSGFSGSLVIPGIWLERGLGDPDAQGGWELANGSIIHTPIYLGGLEIIGLPPVYGASIAVLGNEYILGRRALDLYEITLDHGQRVIARP